MNELLSTTYFPMEQKWSIWNSKFKLIKEWFDSNEAAHRWIIDNGYKPDPSHKNYIDIHYKDYRKSVERGN
jgi:hypothetical protein